MNRKEADIFESIFIRRGFFEQIDQDLHAKDILESYEDLSLPEAIENLTRRIIHKLEHDHRRSESMDRIN